MPIPAEAMKDVNQKMSEVRNTDQYNPNIPEIGWINNRDTRREVYRILSTHQTYLEQPASVSGKYHSGESMRDHIRSGLYWLKEMLDEFKIKDQRRDDLIAAYILHDIGKVHALEKGEKIGSGWKYYPATGWSGNWSKQRYHPKIGSNMMDKSSFANKTKISSMIQHHMSHWLGQEVPTDLDECLVALADYLSSRENCFIKVPPLEGECIDVKSEKN